MKRDIVLVKDGDIRSFVKFAWFPIKTSDNKLVWLENYLYTESFVGDGLSLIPFWISDKRWSNTSKQWEEII